MKNLPILLLCAIFGVYLQAQSVDGTFTFQTDPEKKYSLYVPSSYDENIPQAMMLGFHPLNVNRWDAQAWRDTLIVFAEANDLLLVCPDGGIDGRVDDAIDTAFTTVLIDSVSTRYNIDEEEKYMMGFSWGGKTTYTYGLRRTEQFKGFLVIGAAVELNEVTSIVSEAKEENFYLVHGSNDSPNVRYTPLLNALQDNEACVETEFMSGIGHTIDFPNRNEILSTAFQWLKSNECFTSANEETAEENLLIYPNPFDESFTLDGMYTKSQIRITDQSGRAIEFSLDGKKLTPSTGNGVLLYMNLINETGEVSSKSLFKM